MQNMGKRICQLRKERGLTQMELAEAMGVTDKAVSKWERGLAYPDIQTLPQLAQILGVGVETLMEGKQENPEKTGKTLTDRKLLVLRCVALGMGVSIVVLSLLGQLEASEGLGLAGVGITALAVAQFVSAAE